MSRIRWHLPAMLSTAVLLVLGIVLVPGQAAQGATGVTATFTKTQDWGTGFEGKYTITNGSSGTLATWRVEFNLAAGQTLGSLWDGSPTTSGSHVTVNNTWNGNLAPGGAASVGFNGAACDGSGTPPTTTTTTTRTTTTTTTTTSTSQPPPPPGGAKNVGYFVDWGVYARNYHVKNIETSGSASKLTAINYAFGNVTNGQCAIGDSFADFDKFYDAASSVDGTSDTWDTGALRGSFHQLRELKARHPGLKVIYSFGGWSWSGGFGQAAANPAAFADSCFNLVKDPRWADVFDGIDIDWEYPNACGLSCDSSGPNAFKTLMSALRNRFGSSALVTAAITADGSAGGKIDLTDYAGAAQFVNWFNVMTYDFFGAFNPQGPTAPHSPLTSYAGIPTQGFNADAAITKLKGKGVPASKLLLGIGFYGRGWTGVTQSAPGGSATGPAPGTFEQGIEDYKVLKNTCPSTGTIGGTAYAVCGSNWWGYDNPSTIAGKMNYVKSQGLGGAFFWELTGDTSNGELITAMSNGLR
jgi:chitinase